MANGLRFEKTNLVLELMQLRGELTQAAMEQIAIADKIIVAALVKDPHLSEAVKQAVRSRIQKWHEENPRYFINIYAAAYSRYYSENEIEKLIALCKAGKKDGFKARLITAKHFKEVKLSIRQQAENLGKELASLTRSIIPGAAPQGSANPSHKAKNAGNAAASDPPVTSIIASPGALAKVNQHHRNSEGREWPVAILTVSPPAHGTVTTRNATIPRRGPGGATRMAPVTEVFYQSRPGYAGTDAFAYRRTTEDPADPLNDKTYTVTIEVK